MEKRCFDLETKALRVIGLSLYTNENAFYKLYSYLVIFLVVTSSYCPLHSMFAETENISVVIENFTIGSALFIAGLKIIVGYYIRLDLANYLQILLGKEFDIDAEKYGALETKLIDECLRRCNTQTSVFCAIPFLYIFFANIPSIQQRLTKKSGWFLPYGGLPLWDITYSPNYEFALIYVNLANFAVYVSYMVTTAIVISIMVFLSYQCKILQSRIKTCLPRSFKNDVLQWPRLKNNLKDCLNHLTAIMQISQKFEKLLSYLLLVDFIGLSVIIASCLWHSITLEAYNFKSAQLITLMLTAVVVEFFTTYWGSEMVKEYLAIGDCCYEIDFVGVDLRFQKSLCFMIQQTQRPIQFTVGGFSPLTMQSFLVVMKGAYTCFTFLYQQHKNR